MMDASIGSSPMLVFLVNLNSTIIFYIDDQIEIICNIIFVLEQTHQQMIDFHVDNKYPSGVRTTFPTITFPTVHFTDSSFHRQSFHRQSFHRQSFHEVHE